MLNHDESRMGTPKVHIYGKKYKAVPMSVNGERVFMVTTGRKNSVEVKKTCPNCETKVSRHEVKICELCGDEICSYCLQEHQEECCGTAWDSSLE